MFEQLSYKKKFYGILVLSILLAFTAYKRSFKGTIEMVHLYVESEKNISENQDINLQLLNLKKEINELDNRIGKSIANPEIVQNQVLAFLNEENQDVTISKIDNLHISEDDFFRIYSNKITLNANFNTLLKTIYSFEKDFEYARIASMKFYVLRNIRTKEKELYNDIIFQNYEKKN